jgi:hypothetical protein
MYNEMQAGEDGFDVHIGVLSLWLLITWYKSIFCCLLAKVLMTLYDMLCSCVLTPI